MTCCYIVTYCYNIIMKKTSDYSATNNNSDDDEDDLNVVSQHELELIFRHSSGVGAE